jgi:hypothetical protein
VNARSSRLLELQRLAEPLAKSISAFFLPVRVLVKADVHRPRKKPEQIALFTDRKIQRFADLRSIFSLNQINAKWILLRSNQRLV